MGIGNPVGGGGRGGGMATSLPLMGIGNKDAARQAALTHGLLYSLPLMGIGNVLDHEPVAGAVQVLSLPLMGIGNAVAREADWPTYHDLITPHGDRKLNHRVHP